MKILCNITVFLILSRLLMADVIISGIDFSKTESIASVFKGINQTRGSQNVALTLDATRKLNIVDSSKYPLVDFVYAVGVDGIRMPADKSRLSRNEFLLRLKSLIVSVPEGGQNELYIYLHFDDDISGIEGYRLLKDICDSGVAGIVFKREENKEERAFRLKQEHLPKPSSPK